MPGVSSFEPPRTHRREVFGVAAMPQKSRELTARNASYPSRELVRLVEQSSEDASEGSLDVAELMEPVSMSYAPHLHRADVRALVDRLAFA